MTARGIRSTTPAGLALVLLAGCNSAPTALDDEVTTAPGASVEIPVLANDEDPDNDPLVLADAWGAEHGRVEVTENNTLLYTPDESAEGDDLFYYRVKDNEGKDNQAKVRVTVRDVASPVATVYGIGGEPMVSSAMLDSVLVTLRTVGDPKSADEPVRLVVEQGGIVLADQLVGVDERWSDGNVKTFEIDLEPDLPLSQVGALTVGVQKVPAEGRAPTPWDVIPEVGAELTDGRTVLLIPAEGPITMGGGEPFQRSWRLRFPALRAR